MNCRALLILMGLLALSWSWPTAAAAQYFGRNKVQYENFDWQVLGTPHFELLFYKGEEELAARAAVIAEDAYSRLSKLFDHEFSARVPFVLYASPNDFQQTNIADGLIGEGTGGFSEPIRNRMVLPYPGDNEGFVHVIRHELVHVFMFDLIYQSTRPNAARRAWFPVQLWYAEGAAEWFSTGWDDQSAMWMRDATIHDWLVPLPRLYGGFQVYKEGQSAMRYMAATYGEPKVVEFFKEVGRTRNVEKALERSIGLNEEEFSERWIKALKHEFWPLFNTRQEAEQIGDRKSDHAKRGNYFYQQPELSPDGRWLAYFTDAGGFVDLVIEDALGGKDRHKLLTGYRSNRFLSLHSFDSSLGFSPDGSQLAFIARNGQDERLYIARVPDGKIEREIPLSMDIARSPTWSPDGRQLVISGTRQGQTDLWLVDVESKKIHQLTDDTGDEHDPAWMDGGKSILYSAAPDPVRGVELQHDEKGHLRLDAADLQGAAHVQSSPSKRDIYRLSLEGGGTERLISTMGRDEDPVALGDSLILFVSDVSGARNLWTFDRRSRELARHTDVLGGLFDPSVAMGANRLAFSAFEKGGWDIFLRDDLQNFLKESRFPIGKPLPAPVLTTLPDSTVNAEVEADSLSLPRLALGDLKDAELALGEDEASDGLVTLANLDEVAARGDAEARAVGESRPYSLRWSLDPVGRGNGGVFYTQGFGLGLANTLSASDLLGNHRMSLLVNFYGSIEFSDLAFSYAYLKRRVNITGGIFHYRNFINSNFTSLGEVLESNQIFSERNYGVFGLASLPLNQFSRVDLELQAFESEKTFYDYDQLSGFWFEDRKRADRLVRPSLSYVHDSSFYGSHGPITGSRYMFSASKGLGFGESAVDRSTAYADLRKYFRLWGRNALAFRMLGAISSGNDPRTFVIGGPGTLRGWDIFDFEEALSGNEAEEFQNLSGRKLLLGSAEYRFPFVDALFFGWPGRWAIGPIGGAVFFDVGTAYDGSPRLFGEDENGNFRLDGLKADYGFGIRANLGFLPMRFDWAWKTDFATTSKDIQYNFSIGPEF